MKKITIKNKILILLSFVFIFISSFAISTFAYHVDSNGNLVSDNLINYKDINSPKFTDLGNNSFKMDWRGGVSTITLPYTDFKANTQYSITITKVSGAGYWAYQFYWNYSDNTSVKFTNNQGLGNGTYSYTSAFNKTLSSITIVLNYEATFKDLMLNEGNPKAFEPYGAIYYSSSNYNEAYNIGVNSVFDGLSDFNAIQSYYSSSILFRSTDNGNTYNNLNSLGIAVQNVYNGNLKVSLSAQSWAFGDNVIYYIDIQFTSPIYIANLYLPSLQRPNPQYVRINDVNYDFNYTMVDGVGYFVTRNIYKITDNLRFYFKAYEGMPLSFDIIIKGFNNAIDTYESGFNNGVSATKDSYDPIIQQYKDTIQTLSKRISLLENSNRNYTNLIWTIGATPWESFKHIWNVEFGGINIANIVTGLVTALLVIYLIKKIWK